MAAKWSQIHFYRYNFIKFYKSIQCQLDLEFKQEEIEEKEPEV